MQKGKKELKKAGHKLLESVEELSSNATSPQKENATPEQYAITKGLSGARDTTAQLIEGGNRVVQNMRNEKSAEKTTPLLQRSKDPAEPVMNPRGSNSQSHITETQAPEADTESQPAAEKGISKVPPKAPKRASQSLAQPQVKQEAEDLLNTPDKVARDDDPASFPVQQHTETIAKKSEGRDLSQPPERIDTIPFQNKEQSAGEIQTKPPVETDFFDQPSSPLFALQIEDKEAPLSDEDDPTPLPGSSYVKRKPRPATFDEVYGTDRRDLRQDPQEKSSAPAETKHSLRKKPEAGPADLQSSSAATKPLQMNQKNASLHNQKPALKTAAASSETAVNTARAAQMGTATVNAGVNAASGAATGGATIAMQTGKRVVDKIKEVFANTTRAVRTEAKSTLGKAGAVILSPFVMLFMVCGIRIAGFAMNVGLSDEVNQLMPLIQQACVQWNIPEYVPLVAAVMMQESGGRAEAVGGDVMQCAESMGYPVGTPVPVEESINHGTHLLANYLNQAGSTGPTDLAAISLALQSYNFGGGFMAWAQARGGYSKENARLFAQQQAAAMGWSDYGDSDYVDHVLQYYQISGATGDASLIAGGFFAYPLPGIRWTTYAGHEGIDIATPVGTPVYASAPGTVTYTQTAWNPSMGYGGLASYGNCLFVEHEGGWETRYAHLSTVAVPIGSYVLQGQLIGYSGNTGNSSGPHLHLAIYFNGSPSSGGVIYAEQAWPQHKES